MQEDSSHVHASVCTASMTVTCVRVAMAVCMGVCMRMRVVVCMTSVVVLLCVLLVPSQAVHDPSLLGGGTDSLRLYVVLMNIILLAGPPIMRLSRLSCLWESVPLSSDDAHRWTCGWALCCRLETHIMRCLYDKRTRLCRVAVQTSDALFSRAAEICSAARPTAVLLDRDGTAGALLA